MKKIFNKFILLVLAFLLVIPFSWVKAEEDPKYIPYEVLKEGLTEITSDPNYELFAAFASFEYDDINSKILTKNPETGVTLGKFAVADHKVVYEAIPDLDDELAPFANIMGFMLIYLTAFNEAGIPGGINLEDVMLNGEEGFTIEVQGEGEDDVILKGLEMTLNKERLQELAAEYPLVPDEAPSVIINNKKETSLDVTLKLPEKYNDRTYTCQLYYSEDGTNYEEYFGELDCTGNDSEKASFEDLDPNKKYYFKGKVSTGENFSDVKEVILNKTSTNTPEEPKKEEPKKKEKKNPETGVIANFVFIGSLLSIGAVGYVTALKNKKF